MTRSTANLLILSLIVACISCSQGERKVSLRFKYQPDSVLSYVQTSKRHVSVISADSTKESYNSTSRGSITHKIEDVDSNGNATILETSIWEYSAPSKEDPAIMTQRFDTTIYRIALEPSGRIVNLMAEGDSNTHRLNYVKNYYEQGVPVFPDGEFTTGYSWTQTTNVLLPDENMKASTRYTIQSLVREGGYDCALIEFEGNLVIPVEPKKDDSLQRRGVDYISGKGVMYFAYKEGMVILQRERWAVRGDRQRTVNGKTEEYSVRVTHDVEFGLEKLWLK